MALVTNPDENLSGGQIEQILDTLLYEVLRPLVYHSTVFDTQIVYALSFISRNKKRKISTSNSREESIDYLSRALITDDLDEKFEYIKKSKLERSMIYVFATNILRHYYDSFFTLYQNFLESEPGDRLVLKRRLKVIQDSLACPTRSDLFILLNAMHDATKQYNTYIESIVAQYIKICSKQASFFVDTNPNNNYDRKEVRQNFLKNVVTALNKYNSEHGALTSYIKFWFLNAQTCSNSDHEYGIAYRIPPQHKKKLATGDTASGFDINFSVSLDATVTDDEGEEVTLYNKVESNETVDSSLEHSRFSELLCTLAKNVDPHGIGRLTLGIDEHFSDADLNKMKKHMIKQHLLKV